MILRPYQEKLISDIYSGWNLGYRNVAGVLPTGGGKTVVYSSIVAREPGNSIVMAHRRELVSQTSLALARNKIPHRIVGPDNLVRWCQRQSIAETKINFIKQSSKTAVASVDTLINKNENWFGQISLWVCDETHHLQADNKWGKATQLFPNARGLGMTATLERADGRSLGRPDGILEFIARGPTQRWLIQQGFLLDFVVYGPETKIDMSRVNITASGEFSQKPLRDAVHASQIVGDVVTQYLKYAKDKLGVTFCVDVEHAREMKLAYRAAGVPAEMVTGETPTDLRANLMRDFGNRKFSQLCVVDVVSEGTDIPNIDVVSLARPSNSYVTICQQIGRALRPRFAGDTEKAIIIDHVRNVERIARIGYCEVQERATLELDRATYSLERKEKRSRGKAIVSLTRTCPECLYEYPKVYGWKCPDCGEETPPQEKSAPEQVDGDLVELSPEAIAKIMRGVAKVNGAPTYPMNASMVVKKAIDKRHLERQQAQSELRDMMSTWGGIQKELGLGTRESQRLFYLTFGVDVGTAQGLNAKEALKLKSEVEGNLNTSF